MSETHSTTENNNSHCCDNTCGNADDRVVPDSVEINPLFARPKEAQAFSKFTIPQKGSLPETAYQVVHDEAMLDGNARLNLATFVSTWMDDHANRLYMEAADKNMIDKDEYPKTAEVESRCWHMLADLWHAPDPMNAIGTSTIGSSEACMLGGLALKRRWKEAREKADLPTDRPNLVMSSAVQVCWEKFCNYFDVEPRYVPISEDHKVLDGHDLDKYVDENTIGVVAIMGVTYTGMYEPVEQISEALDRIEERTGLDVRIHVDGVSVSLNRTPTPVLIAVAIVFLLRLFQALRAPVRGRACLPCGMHRAARRPSGVCWPSGCWPRPTGPCGAGWRRPTATPARRCCWACASPRWCCLAPCCCWA